MSTVAGMWSPFTDVRRVLTAMAIELSQTITGRLLPEWRTIEFVCIMRVGNEGLVDILEPRPSHCLLKRMSRSLLTPGSLAARSRNWSTPDDHENNCARTSILAYCHSG